MVYSYSYTFILKPISKLSILVFLSFYAVNIYISIPSKKIKWLNSNDSETEKTFYTIVYALRFQHLANAHHYSFLTDTISPFLNHDELKNGFIKQIKKNLLSDI